MDVRNGPDVLYDGPLLVCLICPPTAYYNVLVVTEFARAHSRTSGTRILKQFLPWCGDLYDVLKAEGLVDNFLVYFLFIRILCNIGETVERKKEGRKC